MSPLSAPVLVVRTPDGDPWPTQYLRVSMESESVDILPDPPPGSAVYRSQHQTVGGAYMEVETKVCDI